MDSKSRRTTFAAGGTSGIPTSVSRPSALSRQSLAPSSSLNTSNNNNPRASLAPTRSLNASRGSTAFASTSQQPSGSQQSSQQFSQGHGGPIQPIAPGTASRNNNFYSSVGSMSVGRSGALRGSQADIPYAPPSERRSSVYRRATTVGGATTPSGANYPHVRVAAMKDPRDLKGSKKLFAEQIVEFLESRRYTLENHNANKSLIGEISKGPTIPQIMGLFRYLVQALDPGFRFPPGPNGVAKKPEDEVPPAMRAIGYPFADSISKSNIQSAGSVTNWPIMLGMLHWIVVMIENRELAFNNSRELHIPAPFDEERPHADAVVHSWLDYIGQSYPKFLATDDFDPDPELAQFYEQTDSGRRSLIARVADLKLEKEALEQELQELHDHPDPLISATKKREEIQRDIEKFHRFIKEANAKVEGQKLQIQELLQIQQEAIRRREEAAATLKDLNAQFVAQGMTTVEIQQLTTDKKNKTEDIRAITNKHRTLQDTCGNSEVELQKRLTKSETLCATYSSKAQSLGLLPYGGPDGFEEINFEQEINGAKENPVMDCLTQIKPALIELRARVKREFGEIESESLELEGIINKEKEILSDLNEDLISMSNRSRGLEADLEAMKEEEKLEVIAKQDDIDKLTTAVNHLNSTGMHNLANAEWRLEQRTAEKQKVLEETSEIRQQTRDLLETALDGIITYKGQMMKQTDLLLEYAALDF